MINQEKINRDKLTGYRKPSETEAAQMAEYLLKDIRHSKTIFTIYAVSFLIFAILIGVRSIPQFGAELISLTMLGSILKIILALVFLYASIKFFKFVRDCKDLALKIMNREFQVLDCLVWNAELDLNGTNTAVVKIYHDDMYCDDWFPVNTNSMKKWQENAQYPFTLLRCEYGSGKAKVKYELFSENRLSERLGDSVI